MRRLTEGHIALGGMALFAIWLFVALPLLYRPNATIQHAAHPAEQHATNQETKSKKDETDEALAYYTLWLMVFTGILAFATIGLGAATVGLYLTGEKQAKIAKLAGLRQFRQTRDSIALTKQSAEAAQRSAIVSEQALIVSQRAYVSVKRPTNANLLDSAKRFRGQNFWVIWENSGNTEAHDFKTAMNGLWFAPDIPDDFDFHDLGEGTFGSTLGARSEIEGGKSFLNPETLKMIAERRCRYYFWGWGEYKDAFVGTPVHRIEFCFEIQIDGDVDNANFSVYFRTHNRHNRHLNKDRTA